MLSNKMVCLLFVLFTCGCVQKPQYLSGLWKSNAEMTIQNNATYNIPKSINYYHYFDNVYFYSIMIENEDKEKSDEIAKTIIENGFKYVDKEILITKFYILKNKENSIKILNTYSLSIMNLNIAIDEDSNCYVYIPNSKNITRNFKEYFCQMSK